MSGSGIVSLPASERPLVSILIPTRSQSELLEICLNSLCRHIGAGIAYEVVIVLNAATNEVKSFVRDRVRGAAVVESQANLGVAGGYNRARSVARGEYLVLLHDDTEIQPGWLESLLETLEKNPAAGAVGSFQFFPDGRPQRAGSILWQDAFTSPAWGDFEPEPRIFTEVRPVDYIGTCSSIVRSSVWDAAGGMNERFYPAYYVDVDLCMRVHRQKRTVLCDPRSRVFHHGSASTSRDFREHIHQRNRARFQKEWAAELELCEPNGHHDREAIARADERTRRRAADLTAAWSASSEPAATPPAFNARRQERQHFKRELKLLRGYRKATGSADPALAAAISDLRVRCAGTPPPVARVGFFQRLLKRFQRRRGIIG